MLQRINDQQEQGVPAIHTLDDLKTLPQWVCYDEQKKPYTPGSSYGAKAGIPATWRTYTEARIAQKANPSLYKGVGFELVKEQCLVLVDFDKCIADDGAYPQWVTDLLSELNSYTERSPSQRGLHVYVRGSIPSSVPPAGDGIEMYDCLRYTTITEDHVEGYPHTIEDRTDVLLALYQRVMDAREQKKKTITRPTKTLVYDPATREQRYAIAALKSAVQHVLDARNGSRNATLNREAFAMGQLCGSGWIERGYVEEELSKAARVVGLSTMEIHKTLRSGIEKGIDNPREDLAEREQDLSSFEASDVGNAEAVQATHGWCIRHSNAVGWLVYCGTHWKPDAECEVDRMVIATLRKRRAQAVESDREAVIKCAKPDNAKINACKARLASLEGIHVEITDFDTDTFLLNTQSGVVDLRTGQTTPHDATQLFTYCLATPIGTAKDAERWVAFLRETVGGGEEVVSYMQRAVGYSITGNTKEEVMFYLYGPTRSGKGTFTEALDQLLGLPAKAPLLIERDFNTFTAKRDASDQNFDLAALRPARIVTASESNKYQSLNPAKIKALTGGNNLTAAFKGKDAFTYRPQFKVWLSSNHHINADASDDAIWGRVKVIEFPHSHLGAEDKSLKEYMKGEEAQRGILWWAIQGAIAWYAEKSLATPVCVQENVEAQRYSNDYVGQWLEEVCELDADTWTATATVRASYAAWCEANDVEAMHNKGFNEALRRKGCNPRFLKKEQGVTMRVCKGIRIKSAKIPTRLIIS